MRYWADYLDLVNVNDLLKWIANKELMMLVDEEKGGIIGYIHQIHSDKVVQQLNNLENIKNDTNV